ncbi:putative flagellar hook protein [Selenomonas ruminantium subsp. lactilytica TAM6421]|uniref:Flagellar hook protein FlgE n=1 Tax=Selenomonas ruminantium subsp. lactilytica (strain NBRC 103574 / TAM6421) TaxID=927704 RepID=I0GN62_SELRL|nr:flagellar hook protein FlgE [Selenomonas ruminantium]BAL82199.1 putative flagellar hook protein [Selenomonas ruminantium subsp. lactilytica TAM6421]
MMRSLYSGVSGVKGHQTRMDVVGNNIANVNTTGFKSGRVTFADTLSQTQSSASAPTGNLGGTNPKQIGLGVGVATIDTLFTDGAVQATGKNTDLCLSGNGLFVVKSGSETYYTRNGAFEFDESGNYVLPGNGMKVQGWMGTDGVVSTTGAIEDIVIQTGKSMAAKASEKVTYSYNLKANPPVVTQYSFTDGTNSYTRTTDGYWIEASATQPVTVTFSDGTKTTYTSGTYTIGRSLPVTTSFNFYDSLGSVHTATVLLEKADVGTLQYTDTNGDTITKTGTAWSVLLGSTVDVAETDGSTTHYDLGGNTLTFDEDGILREATSFATPTTLTADPNTTVTTPSYTPSQVGTTSAATIALTATITAPNGSSTPQSMTLDYSGVTSYADINTVNADADGNAAGTLKSISIDSSGVITGVYTNSVRQSEAQVAIAQFSNASGLTKTGSSLYQTSNNSGTPNIKAAADLGCSITPSALEMSNVDIANEFSDMIITQRGFQSNSKIITTSDEMLETMINMKR